MKKDIMESEQVREEMKETEKLKGIRQLLSEEEGMGTVEIILIIVVLVGLVIVFKNQITQVVNNIFNKITSQTNKI
jgi:Flp pilus assembly pilin Flp